MTAALVVCARPDWHAGPCRETARPPLVGLVGRARAGKDTVAARLVEAHGFERHAFADALRTAALALDPIVVPVDTVAGSRRLSDVVRDTGWEGAKSIREVRRTLQNYGVAIRELDPGFWVRPVLAAVAASDRPAVITDVRFRNEADAVIGAGGILVRVNRPGIDMSDTHISETNLLSYPTRSTLANDSDLPTLHKRVDALVQTIH